MKKIIAKVKDEDAFERLSAYISNGEGIHRFIYTARITINIEIEVTDDTLPNILNIITLLKNTNNATGYHIFDIADSELTDNKKSEYDTKIASGVTAHKLEQDKTDTLEFQVLLPLAKVLLLGNQDTPQLEAMSYPELEDYYIKFTELHELIVLYYYTRHGTIPTDNQIKTTNNTVPAIEMRDYLRMKNVLL